MDLNATKNPSFTAIEFCVKVVRVAASYLTACDEVFKSSTGYTKSCARVQYTIHGTHPMCRVIFAVQPYDHDHAHLQ